MNDYSRVYMIGSKIGTFVKIGVSGNPARRLRDLQTASPLELELLATVPGGQELEQVLHIWFAELRVRGEWFRFPHRDAVDQLREAVHYIGFMDGCPFDWTELHVDVLSWFPPRPHTWRERVADYLRPIDITADRKLRLTLCNALIDATRELRGARYREYA